MKKRRNCSILYSFQGVAEKDADPSDEHLCVSEGQVRHPLGAISCPKIDEYVKYVKYDKLLVLTKNLLVSD